jgi:hypothetical protein
MLPTTFRFIWPSGFREYLKKSTNQKQELPVAAMFVNGSGQNKHHPAKGNVSFCHHLASVVR